MQVIRTCRIKGFTVSVRASLRGQRQTAILVLLQHTIATIGRGKTRQSDVLFGENSKTRIAKVTDGLSHTIAVAETLHDVHNGECSAWGLPSLGNGWHRRGN